MFDLSVIIRLIKIIFSVNVFKKLYFHLYSLVKTTHPLRCAALCDEPVLRAARNFLTVIQSEEPLCDNRIFSCWSPFFVTVFRDCEDFFHRDLCESSLRTPFFVAHYPGFKEKEVRIQLKYQRTCENIFLHVTLSFSKGLFIYQWRKRLSASGR